MKKAIIISFSIILAVIVTFLCVYFFLTAPKFKGDFSVSDFQTQIENINFQTDKNYGNITDFKSAAKAGKTAIAERFQNSSGGIFEWMCCDVRYDKENDAYYVRTYHASPRILGGAYDVIIQSDGTILTIWGENWIIMKKFLTLILCTTMLFCFTSCAKDDSDITYDKLFDTYPSVFVTENIDNITFYAYYGQGKGSKVPNKYMEAITDWLDSFTIVREATDEDVLDGTNTYYVKIEYSNGTVIKEGLDIIWVDDTRYLLEKDKHPDCFEEIISKTNYK